MKLVVIGSSNTDMVIKANRLPKPGETIIGNEFFIAAGGKGANQAVAASRAGGEVHFIARVGDDMFGHQAIAGFQKDHINTDKVFIDRELPSGVAQIMVDQFGENSIVVAPGANGNLLPSDIDRCWADIQAADIVLMQLESPLATIEYVLQKIDHSQTKVVLNPAPAAALNPQCLKGLYLLTPNETETSILTGIKTDTLENLLAAGKKLLANGVSNVIITRGSKGCIWISQEGHQSFAGYKVKPVDTTAAGDVFNGALCAALAQQKSLAEAIKFASAAAAISVTRNGAQRSAPFKEEIFEFMESAGKGQ